jgi:hypothetical protein
VTPWSPVELYCLDLHGRRILLFACLTHYSTLKMDTAYNSEMSPKLYQSTWCHIPEDSTGLVTAVRTSDPACLKYFYFLMKYSELVLKGQNEATGVPYLGSSLLSDMSEPTRGFTKRMRDTAANRERVRCEYLLPICIFVINKQESIIYVCRSSLYPGGL